MLAYYTLPEMLQVVSLCAVVKQSVTLIDGSPVVPTTASSPPTLHQTCPHPGGIISWSVVSSGDSQVLCTGTALFYCSTPSYSSPPSKTLIHPHKAAIWSKTYVCSHFKGGITGLNPTEGMDIFLLCVLCVVEGVQVAAAVMG